MRSCIISFTKTASKKFGTWIHSMNFLSPDVALYLYKSTIQSCMEDYCNFWGGAPRGYLELLDKLWKWISRTLDPSLAASLEPLAHHWNVASLIFFYRYYFDRCHLNWLTWFHFFILEGYLLVILIDCMIFLLPFLDVTRMSMPAISFLAQPVSGILCL